MFNGLIDLDNYGPYVSKIVTAKKSNDIQLLIESLKDLVEVIDRDSARTQTSKDEIATAIFDNYPSLREYMSQIL